MDARTSRRQKRYSKQQEKRVAKQINGHTQANSGATRLGGGGDVRGSGFRIECKYTEKPEYVLHYKDLEKIRKQAIKTLEQPIFLFGFKQSRLQDMFCVIQWRTDIPEKYLYELDTTSKSLILEKAYLRMVLLKEQKRLRLTFRMGAVGQQYEVLHWDNFLANKSETNA